MEEERWLEKLNGNPVDWLLNSNPWTRYRTLTDLLDREKSSEEVHAARRRVLEDPQVRQLVREAADWMPLEATRNSDPKISYFKLRMLADFGLIAGDEGMDEIYRKATEHRIDGMFACRGHLPEKVKKGEKYEKPDPAEDVWHLAPCNSPMISYALLALGYQTEAVLESVERLKQLWAEEPGWFCHLFFVESQFKREKAGCPVAGMMALEVFSEIGDQENSVHTRNAYAPLEYHYRLGKSIYYFGRSKKFWTLKYPYVWYNALYLADVLSRFSFLKKSPLLAECIDWILGSQDADGRFRPTSIFMPYREWDFGNKKEASPWITFLCCRVLRRYFS